MCVAGACRSGRPLYCTADTLHSASGSCNATTMHHSHLLPPARCAHTHTSAHICYNIFRHKYNPSDERSSTSIITSQRWAQRADCTTVEHADVQSRCSGLTSNSWFLNYTLFSQFPVWETGTETLERRKLLARSQWDRQVTAPSPFKGDRLI